MTLKNKIIWLLFILFAAILIINIPFASSKYMLRVFNMTLITYICVLSMFVIFGMCGQISFSQAGFWGIGAYISAILTVKLHVSPLIAFFASAIGTAAIAFILGFALFRLKGHYFGFATIGVVMTLYGIFQNWKPVTGGADGISDIPPFRVGAMEFNSEMSNFYLILFIAITLSIVTEVVRRSSLGRSFVAIRDNEIAAKCMGVNSYLTKNIAFAIAGVYSGIAGSLFAFLGSYISPTSFNFSQSAMFLVMLMLGGFNSLPGPILGSTLLMLLPEWFRPLQDYIMLIYGLGVILLMIVMPEGLIGGGKILYEKFIERKGKRTNSFKKQANTDIG